MIAEAAAASSAVQEELHHDDYEDDGLGDTVWLLSIAAPDERALLLQTRSAAQEAAADAISRCAAIIKDADSHVYRRGMAVLALGKTLGRELGIPQSRNSASMKKFRQVLKQTGSYSGRERFEGGSYRAKVVMHVCGNTIKLSQIISPERYQSVRSPSCITRVEVGGTKTLT